MKNMQPIKSYDDMFQATRALTVQNSQNKNLSPSFTKPFDTTPGQQGGLAGHPPPLYLKNHCPIRVKFCGVLETSLNVLEMLSCLHSVYLVTMATPQRRGVLSGKSVDFSRKYQCFKLLPNSQT